MGVMVRSPYVSGNRLAASAVESGRPHSITVVAVARSSLHICCGDTAFVDIDSPIGLLFTVVSWLVVFVALSVVRAVRS